MAGILSPQLERTPVLLPGLRPSTPVGDERMARAEGLTEDEALMLTTWLRASGYGAIEVVHGPDHVSVVWSK